MKTKLEMAHDYAMKHIQEGWDINYDVLVLDAWQYADAMQAEADKRKPSGLPESLRERHDFTEAIAKGVENYEKEEWQPDWSQAPDWANWWCLSVMHGAMWFSRELICTKATWAMLNDVKFCAASFDEAPSFNYQGDWRESLRKRPK